MLSRTKPEDHERFVEELEAPLMGESGRKTEVRQETIERENEAFDALMGMTGKK